MNDKRHKYIEALVNRYFDLKRSEKTLFMKMLIKKNSVNEKNKSNDIKKCINS